jgi:hypothetical protein
VRDDIEDMEMWKAKIFSSQIPRRLPEKPVLQGLFSKSRKSCGCARALGFGNALLAVIGTIVAL